MMEKYTVVGSYYYGHGSYLPFMDRIETDNLKEALTKVRGDVAYIFVGWPEEKEGVL